MTHRLLIAALVAAALAACSDDQAPPADTADTALDANDDVTTADDAPDVASDVAPDVASDIADDADAGSVDTTPDAADTDVADATPDTADVAPDAPLDTAPDTDVPDGFVPFDTLSEYGFFVGDLVDQTPAPGVVPYTVASPLWADHAGKGRYFVLPPGTTATPVEGEGWTFPDGTIVIKTFFFSLDRRDPVGDARIVETRLLVREDDDWLALTYVWNDEQTEATRVIAGTRLTIDHIDVDGNPATQTYIVPNQNQCGSCHERSDEFELLGPITHQLNTPIVRDGEVVNQLEWLVDQGVIDALPGELDTLPAFPDPAGDAPLEDRARAWLHANCAHCHRPGGGGGRAGLVLLAWEDDPGTYGICKAPVAAGAGAGGRHYDIVPGHPEQSIIPFRMASTVPEIKMPELPNLIPDDFGVELISAWIAEMDGPACE